MASGGIGAPRGVGGIRQHQGTPWGVGDFMGISRIGRLSGGVGGVRGALGLAGSIGTQGPAWV